MSKTIFQNIIYFPQNTLQYTFKTILAVGYLGNKIVKLLIQQTCQLLTKISTCFLRTQKLKQSTCLSQNKPKKIKVIQKKGKQQPERTNTNKVKNIEYKKKIKEKTKKNIKIKLQTNSSNIRSHKIIINSDKPQQIDSNEKPKISEAIWRSGATQSREHLEDVVYSTIGNTKANISGLPQSISKMVVEYLEEYQCFGEREWLALCGSVDPAPLLPPNFSDIWNGPCPIFPGKKVCETHMLVYIPATVDGKPFTFNKLGEIAKRFFPKNDNGFRYIFGVTDELRDKPIKSRWVLMIKDVIPGSRNKSYPEQEKIIAELAEKSLGYKIPSFLEAATCILTQYFFDSKTRLFTDDPWTYSRCKEQYGDQILVGGFDPIGLRVFNFCDFPFEYIGVAALRKF